MPITVLHLLGPLRPSGMERMLATASQAFLDEEINSIVVGQGNNHSFGPALKEAGYPVYAIPRLGRDVGAARDLKRIVRRHQADIIHIHTESNYLQTAVASRWALGRRGALVRTVHNVFDARGRWYWTRMLQALLGDRLMAAVTVPSYDVAENERRFGRFRVRIILNWVDERFFSLRLARDERSSTKQVPLAVIVGNCSPIKHHELALNALVSAGHRVWHVGDETEASRKECDLLKVLDISGRLIARGIQDPAEALAAADYFVLPSRHEGMPVALAEAIAAGVPAFVNDMPGAQWARGLPSVTFVAGSEESWRDAITAWPESMNIGSGDSRDIDLSAGRGAKQYAEVYRLVLA